MGLIGGNSAGWECECCEKCADYGDVIELCGFRLMGLMNGYCWLNCNVVELLGTGSKIELGGQFIDTLIEVAFFCFQMKSVNGIGV
jgi:hypothetical protein